MKLTFIGNGAMAKAMIAGLIDSYEIEVIGRDPAKLKALNISFENALSLGDLQEGIDITDKHLIVCVKPYALESIRPHLKGQAASLISVLAGISLASLRETIHAVHTIRAMPNLAAAHHSSMTLLTGDEPFKTNAQTILQSIGKTLWLESEKEFDIAMALTGSGPAFLALVAEAMCDGVVREGLKRDDATYLAKGLFDGFAPLLSANHPAHIKEAVMSPGGVTAEGVGALESGNVRNAFMEAMRQTYLKVKK